MDDRLPLSVLLLARDERAALAGLLPSLAFAREIVVVADPRGGPGVRETAERLGARVFERAFDGFGPQRRHALAQCTQDWVLWIDADERLEPGAPAAIGRALGEGATAGWRLRRDGWFLGRRIRHCGWRGERVLRLFRRAAARFDDAPVHERVAVEGMLRDLEGAAIEHRSYETFGECVAKMTRYAHAGAEKARRAGRRAGPLAVLVRPPLRFVRMYLLQAGVLDGAHGLLLCLFAAAQVFLKYAELWDLTRRADREPDA
jgi:(heptosyl)LPS beta-1,4-glucosyltransferase